MTKEQEEAIEKLTNGEKIDFNTLVRKFKREGIENFVVTKKEYIETVLSMLKEKDRQIDFYKKGLEREIESNRDNIMEIIKKDKEIEKKDKIIDLMAEEIKERKYVFTNKTKKDIKQYFERKSENEN